MLISILIEYYYSIDLSQPYLLMINEIFQNFVLAEYIVKLIFDDENLHV